MNLLKLTFEIFDGRNSIFQNWSFTVQNLTDECNLTEACSQPRLQMNLLKLIFAMWKYFKIQFSKYDNENMITKLP